VRFDIPVMIAVAVACLPIFFTGNSIVRWEGALFLGYYISYLVYLILESTQHDTLPVFSTVMLAFIIPITVVTFITVTLRSIRANRKNAAASEGGANLSKRTYKGSKRPPVKISFALEIGGKHP
jgi:cation:H+ antiporter